MRVYWLLPTCNEVEENLLQIFLEKFNGLKISKHISNTIYPLSNFLLSLPIFLNLQIPPRRKPMNLILININFTLLLPFKDLVNLLNIPRRKILIQRPNMNLQWLTHLLHVF